MDEKWRKIKSLEVFMFVTILIFFLNECDFRQRNTHINLHNVIYRVRVI
jgi:hypothetical protein